MSTLTVYPNAGDPGTTSCDGEGYDFNSTWATVRGSTSATTTSAVAQTITVETSFEPSVYSIRRGFLLFDTSALTAGATITAAVLSLSATGTSASNDDTSHIHIVSSTPASNTTLANADFDQVGAVSFASKTLASWVSTSGTYNDFTLDANGIANISKTGVSKFAVRIGRDLDNAAPTGFNIVVFNSADQVPTTTLDPKLVITYTTSNIKTFNGVAIASVKAINGVALASIKTWNGIA